MPGSDRFNRKPALPQIIVATGAAARGPSVARQARLLRTGDDHFAVKPPSITKIQQPCLKRLMRLPQLAVVDFIDLVPQREERGERGLGYQLQTGVWCARTQAHGPVNPPRPLPIVDANGND